MKVKTLRDHQNEHGDKFEKTKGDVYSLPDGHAETLIRRELVEKVADDDKDKRVSGTGKDAGGASKSDG